MSDFFSTLEMVLSIIFVIIGFTVAWGFWPLAWGPKSSPGVRSLSRAVLLLSSAIAIRVLYYSGALVSLETIEWIGLIIPNTINTILLIWGGYYMLRVLYFTVPDEERHSWTILTAPFYPRRWSRLLSRKMEEFIDNAKGDIKDD
jgi:hypothetical protein